MKLLDFAPIEALTTPVPAMTRSYTPVPNDSLLSTIEYYMKQADLEIVGAKMKTASNGQQFMGTVQVRSPKIADPDLGMNFGFRNSYNKSFAVGFGAGAEVFICSNGMFTADVKAVRKHTVEVYRDMNNIVQEQIYFMKNSFDGLVADKQQLMTTFISMADVQEIIWQLWVEQKVLTGTQMNILKKEMFYSENFKMYDPKNEFERPNASAWNMYNNITEALKISHPSNYFKDHEKAHELILSYCN